MYLYEFTDSPSVANVTVSLNAPSSFGYSITVICAIDANSGADQCVVTAVPDGGVAITGVVILIVCII